MAATQTKELNKAKLLEFYRLMRLIREFERECERQYTRGNIKGFLHVYTGEEAIAVGAIAALTDRDYVVTHYRDHGHALARGLDADAVMAELFGKATGVSKGKGGSMHLFDTSKNFMGGYAIVGGQLPIAAGLALASQFNNENRVALCFMGDGALNEGEFHESMNLAAVWNLPVIFFCENNLYGMGAPSSDTLAVHRQMYKLADAYGMDNYRVDGNDVVAVHQLMMDVVDNVRAGKGPAFIEARTYRIQGHSIADPANYRPDEEVEYWRSQDPIPRFKDWMTGQGLAKEEEFSSIDSAVDQEVVNAAEFADASPFPGPEELLQGVYQ